MTIRDKVVTRLFMLRTMSEEHRQSWISEIEKGGYLKPYIKSKLTIMLNVATEMITGLTPPNVEEQLKTLNRMIDDNNRTRVKTLDKELEPLFLEGLPDGMTHTFLTIDLCATSLSKQFKKELERMGLLDLFNRYCVAFNEYAKFYDKEIVK